MTPWSINRISATLLAVIAASATLLTGYTVYQASASTTAIEARERQIATAELAQAVAELDEHLRGVVHELASWDETRQQINYREYYTLWRDSRVHDIGLLPAATNGLALYDKHGLILKPDDGPAQLPARMPANVATTRISLAGEQANLLLYQPIYADPGKSILLGHLGLRIDLLTELRNSRHFRYVDPASLALDLADETEIDPLALTGHLRHKLQPSPYSEHFREVLWNTLIRLLAFVLTILAAIAFLIHRTIARPLRAIARDIDALDSAHDPIDTPTGTTAQPVLELDQVRQSLLGYRKRVAELHRCLELSANAFEHQAYHDALTGVLNRRAYDEELDKLGGQRTSDHHALLLFDCDRFKAINDRFGHDVGDRVLRTLADALGRAVRMEDRVYRIGGDEFVTLLPGADAGMAMTIARRCQEQVRAIDHAALGLSEPVEISIGVAVDDGRLPMRELHRHADQAMYRAKHDGQHKIAMYSPRTSQEPALTIDPATGFYCAPAGD